jgi:hypothetical protein
LVSGWSWTVLKVQTAQPHNCTKMEKQCPIVALLFSGCRKTFDSLLFHSLSLTIHRVNLFDIINI